MKVTLMVLMMPMILNRDLIQAKIIMEILIHQEEAVSVAEALLALIIEE